MLTCLETASGAKTRVTEENYTTKNGTRGSMDDKFTFWYPVKLLKQMSFEGKAFTIPQYGEGHIQNNGVLMCKQSKEVLTNKIKGENSKILKVPMTGKKLCCLCEAAWKEHPDSPWYRFVNGQKIESKPLPELIRVPQDT